jgi:hypothetical protein
MILSRELNMFMTENLLSKVEEEHSLYPVSIDIY